MTSEDPGARPVTAQPNRAAPAADRHRSSTIGMFTLRYGIGGALVLLGIVLLIASPGGFGAEGFGLSGGAGLSIIMVNVIYRLGVSGDKEREREEEARRYMAKHGHWPDEPRRRP